MIPTSANYKGVDATRTFGFIAMVSRITTKTGRITGSNLACNFNFELLHAFEVVHNCLQPFLPARFSSMWWKFSQKNANWNLPGWVTPTALSLFFTECCSLKYKFVRLQLLNFFPHECVNPYTEALFINSFKMTRILFVSIVCYLECGQMMHLFFRKYLN